MISIRKNDDDDDGNCNAASNGNGDDLHWTDLIIIMVVMVIEHTAMTHVLTWWGRQTIEPGVAQLPAVYLRF